MARLFGTDGIRGEVGEYPLTQEAVFAIGRSLGIWLKEQYPQQESHLKVLIGKDTRESGSELELALLRGMKEERLQALRAGVCPTPAVAYLTRTLDAHLGIAISASHNPCTDNGIKFFDGDGYKLFSLAESRLEEIFLDLFSDEITPVREDFSAIEERDYISLYSDFLKSSPENLDLSKITVVIDCAFGAFSKIAPDVLEELGAKVFVINDQPDGKNINADCGTLYPQVLAGKVLQYKADLGIAFDGDGDRVIVIDEKGNILDGDHILAILARHLGEQRRLNGNSIICTQMSNIGLEFCLQRMGIRMVRTRVGDKYVLQEMLKQRANLGGEQSGHIILLERTTTGDGLVVALELIKVMLKTKNSLSTLAKDLFKFPQVLVNVKVKEKRPLDEIPGLNEAIARCQSELGKRGRLLVRYSGTENLARIMIEGEDSSFVNKAATSLAQIIEEAAGER